MAFERITFCFGWGIFLIANYAEHKNKYKEFSIF
jgi:hypothetical protein